MEIRKRIGNGSGSARTIYENGRRRISNGSMVCIEYADLFYITVHEGHNDFSVLQDYIKNQRWARIFNYAFSILEPRDIEEIIISARKEGYNEGWNAHVDLICERK